MIEKLRQIITSGYLIGLISYTVLKKLQFNFVYDSDKTILLIVFIVSSVLFHLSVLNTESKTLKGISYIVVPLVTLFSGKLLLLLLALSMIPILIEDKFKIKILKIVVGTLYSTIVLASIVSMIILPGIITKNSLTKVNERISMPDKNYGYIVRYYEKDAILEGLPQTQNHVIIVEKVIFNRLSYPLEIIYDGEKLTAIKIVWNDDRVTVNDHVYLYKELEN